MPTLDTFRDLYEEAKAEVQADASTELNDFEPGSFLDAVAGIAATESRAVMRWIARQMRRAFIGTAPDEDLEFVAVDTFGPELAREAGESADDYRARVEQFRNDALWRGTPAALRYYVETIDGVVGVTVDESTDTGVTTLTIIYDDDVASEADLEDEFFAADQKWRPVGEPINLQFAPVIDDFLTADVSLT